MWWLKHKIIEFLGGYVSAEDAINAIEKYEERRLVLTYAVKRLFNTIGPDDILKENEYGQWSVGGKVISDDRKKQLIKEANDLQQTYLWDIIQLDLQWQPNRKMYILATSDLEITAGKLWQYTVDCINTRLKSMVNGSGSFNKQKK